MNSIYCYRVYLNNVLLWESYLIHCLRNVFSSHINDRVYYMLN